ncbi:MAG: hypothetical protein GXP56_09535 [Deltaproteobacteria bacterium]|nr:hypothetical protein [Deltaproteobacteria bacterium]
MQEVLISLQADLASGIAIRYACQLEKSARFNMNAIHIPDMDEKGHSPGSGWVHQTWENAVIQQARKKIAQLVKEDLFYCYLTRNPKIVPGEKEQVLLDEMRQKNYDFFIEGLLHSFEPDRFFQRLDSRLYRGLACPVLMVQNLTDLEKGIQIVGTRETVFSVLPWYFKLLKSLPEKPDILLCHFEAPGGKASFIENDTTLISGIEDRFLKHGKKPGRIRTVKGSPNELGLLVRDHALIASVLPQSRSSMASMLSMSPCPILLCPESKID